MLAWPLASFQRTDEVTYLLKVQVSLATWAKTPYWRCVALSLLARSCGGRLLTWATSWHHFSCLPEPVPSCLDLLISFQMQAAVDQPGRHHGPNVRLVLWQIPKTEPWTEFPFFFLWKSHVLTGIYGAILEACALLFSLGTYTRLSKQPRRAPWKDNPPPSSLPQRTPTFQGCASSPSSTNGPYYSICLLLKTNSIKPRNPPTFLGRVLKNILPWPI